MPTHAPHTAELDRLADEIAELSAHLEAATARLLDLIRQFDARGGWNTGFRSCAALARGELSYAKVHALTRVATPETEARLVLRGRLAPEVGALLLRALDAAREALYQRSRESGPAGPATDPVEEAPPKAQQHADALALLAETALHQGLDPGAPGSMRTPQSWRTRLSPGSRCSRMGRAFPRERRGGWLATRAGW